MRRSLAFPGLYATEAQTETLHLCRAGRQLIYSLSQKHRNSLVLNYAIQRILQAGHEEEVASIGSSLASYFSVFHRLLTNRLKQVPQADAATLQSLATELKVRPCTVTCEIAKCSEYNCQHRLQPGLILQNVPPPAHQSKEAGPAGGRSHRNLQLSSR